MQSKSLVMVKELVSCDRVISIDDLLLDFFLFSLYYQVLNLSIDLCECWVATDIFHRRFRSVLFIPLLIRIRRGA